MFLRSKSWHSKNEHLSNTFGYFCSKVLDRCSILGKLQKYPKSTIPGLKKRLNSRTDSLVAPRCKTWRRCRRNAPLIWWNFKKKQPLQKWMRKHSPIRFSQKMRKHYESSIQLNTENGKNLVRRQHFCYSRLLKWWTRPEIARRQAGRRAVSGRVHHLSNLE